MCFNWRNDRDSAYDYEFVAVAEDLAVRLVTADRQVLQAFPSIAVSPDKFIV
jgi:predicted nucleic acid-binding protein